MMRRVVDTNVPVVANGRDTNASIDCRLAAVDFLNELCARGKVAFDLGGEIQDEYHRHLNPRGEPGVGDRFYLMILNSAPSRVQRIELPSDPLTRDFQDFPRVPELAGFDLSDRKFAAVARRLGIPVANATDGGWLDYHAALKANGIEVEFVCGCDPAEWFADH